MQPLVRYSYENVVTFGGCQEDFMLVVTSEASCEVDSIKRGLHLLDSDRASSEDSAGTTKLLFNAGKPQVNTWSFDEKFVKIIFREINLVHE